MLYIYGYTTEISWEQMMIMSWIKKIDEYFVEIYTFSTGFTFLGSLITLIVHHLVVETTDSHDLFLIIFQGS